MADRQSEKIKLWGIVQGVGFRPYVAKTAEAIGMKGEVLNIGGLVEINVTDTAERITYFIDRLIADKPEPAEIVHIRRSPAEFREYSGFTIISSDRGDDEAAMIPADLAICPNCLRELYDRHDTRYQHPFISCMVCGPRYTIIDRIPYDRENTSMVDFPMCRYCEDQYTDLHDRRHHAQTISCHGCGPQLLWKTRTTSCDMTYVPEDMTGDEHRSRNSAILDSAADILKNGGVIAFKSVGGYNLVADPLCDEAVHKLRTIKKRESKPFAVMFRDLDEIRSFSYISDTETKLISSSARPIILLEHRESDSAEINRSRFTGSFLPSFAAQYMLLDRISPLIFTSANLSDMPMIKDESEMFDMFEKEPLIDGVLYNTRRILLRADDSVARVIDDQPQMIRRSKGYAPVPLYMNSGRGSVFATGGQLKNSFALTKGSFAYVSQYFGDMDTIENQTLYEESLRHVENLFRIKPELIVCDMHPLYFTTGFAERYSAEHDIPLIKVQHHHAHVASVIAENDLDGDVIGISFDGTGYGTDGAVWGGEFFLCNKGDSRRISHLKYVDLIGGDSSAKDAMRSALGYIHAFDTGYMSHASDVSSCHEIPVDISDIIEYGRGSVLDLPNASTALKAIENSINTIRSSSMGRLFDGVSALLGIKTYNDYEGQCAIMLEDAAAFALKHPGASRQCDLALSFHNRITDMIVEQCIAARSEYGAHQVALTGGTFQNKILMESTLAKLRSSGFTPYYNISVSPNDGGLALGQAYIATHREKTQL